MNARTKTADDLQDPDGGALLRTIIEQMAAVQAALAERNEQLRDTAERLQESERAAQLANRTKSAFLANVSHELRTPLNVIIGYSELVLDEIEDESDPAQLRSDIKRIHSAGRQLLGLINDVLDLAKIEAGKVEIRPEPFSLHALIQEAHDAAAVLAIQNGNTLDLDLCDDVEMFTGRGHVRQILMNLLSNAAKFTESGRITVQARRQQDTISISVADTGIGMSADTLSRVFDAFVQAEASNTRRYAGTGLGLAICRDLSRLLGGGIEAESTEGVGSQFTITLPIQYRARATAA